LTDNFEMALLFMARRLGARLELAQHILPVDRRHLASGALGRPFAPVDGRGVDLPSEVREGPGAELQNGDKKKGIRRFEGGCPVDENA
jgi:hypothetical protein